MQKKDEEPTISKSKKHLITSTFTEKVHPVWARLGIRDLFLIFLMTSIIFIFIFLMVGRLVGVRLGGSIGLAGWMESNQRPE